MNRQNIVDLEIRIIKNDLVKEFKKKLESNPKILKIKFGEKNSPILLYSVRCLATKIFNYLLKIPEIKVNASDDEGTTALINAAIKNKPAMVKKLLDRPEIKVNAKTIYGKTALINAAQKGYTQVVNLLLDHGANVRLRETKRTKKSCANRNASNMARMCGHKNIYRKIQNKKIENKKIIKSRKKKLLGK